MTLGVGSSSSPSAGASGAASSACSGTSSGFSSGGAGASGVSVSGFWALAGFGVEGAPDFGASFLGVFVFLVSLVGVFGAPVVGFPAAGDGAIFCGCRAVLWGVGFLEPLLTAGDVLLGVGGKE